MLWQPQERGRKASFSGFHLERRTKTLLQYAMHGATMAHTTFIPWLSVGVFFIK